MLLRGLLARRLKGDRGEWHLLKAVIPAKAGIQGASPCLKAPKLMDFRCYAAAELQR